MLTRCLAAETCRPPVRYTRDRRAFQRAAPAFAIRQLDGGHYLLLSGVALIAAW